MSAAPTWTAAFGCCALAGAGIPAKATVSAMAATLAYKLFLAMKISLGVRFGAIRSAGAR
jgi:hypothetical protein